jgi:hypothetical protein
VSMSLSFRGTDHRAVTIQVTSEEDQLDCCYFASGADEVIAMCVIFPSAFTSMRNGRRETSFFLISRLGSCIFSSWK